MQFQSKMYQEIQEIPDAVSNLLEVTDLAVDQLANQIKDQLPNFVFTAARGSSDHAAKFLKYLFEIYLGIPVVSLGPSICSIYSSKLSLNNTMCIGISQSGQSPDIISVINSAKNKECITASFTNDSNSPLAQKTKFSVPLQAGSEKSVAATKTFTSTLVVCLVLVAKVKKDVELLSAIYRLPEMLEKAIRIEWPELKNELESCNKLYTLGRGLSYSISSEASLKLIETCGIHASSYSSAEVLHGPVEIVDEYHPVIALISRDAAEQSIVNVCENIAERKAKVFGTSSYLNKSISLEFVDTGHPFTDPIALIASFYPFVENLSLVRGKNPDQPSLLKKVTKTI